MTPGPVVVPMPEALPITPPATKSDPSLNRESVGTYPIDLPTALQLANAGNYQVAFAREQIQQAFARAQGARVLWLPSIRLGADYNKHDGQIQDIQGNVFPTSRGNYYGGLGAGAPSAASPTFPGLYANFKFADALFEPLAARQAANARRFAAAAVTNDTLLKVSLGYVELLRAAAERSIATETRENARQLAELTGTYARSGQGLQSDADRARTELAIRKNEVSRSNEAVQVASTRLAQLLRLDVTVSLDPADPTVLPIDLLAGDPPVGELVAQGLTQRPEMAENRALVAQAVARMQRERYAVFMPSVILGASYGVFGGGKSGVLPHGAERMDADVIAYWEMRNLGFGEAAARAESRSVLRQADVNRLAAMDLVAREVVEAHAQVIARREQIAVAEEGVELALASHDRNLQRIMQAQGLPIEVLQSNQALAQARREYLRAVTDYNIAQFTLYRALGWPVCTPPTFGQPISPPLPEEKPAG